MKKRLLIMISLLLAGSCLQAMELDEKRESSEDEEVENGILDDSSRVKSLNNKIIRLENRFLALKRENFLLHEKLKKSRKILNDSYEKHNDPHKLDNLIFDKN